MIPVRWRQNATFLLSSLLLILATLLAGCGPSAAELAAVDYAPLAGDDWPVSTPEEQGLDPMLVAELYHNAAALETRTRWRFVQRRALTVHGSGQARTDSSASQRSTSSASSRADA